MTDSKVSYSTLVFGILIGLALGIVIGMWSPPAAFETPTECDGQAFWCWLARWQTLLAGLIAGVTAVAAASVAWKAAMKQIQATTKLPIVLRTNEIEIEIRKLEQIASKLEMYRTAANETLENLGPRETNEITFVRSTLEAHVNIMRPTETVLESMAEVCSMPELRTELKNCARNVGGFNKSSNLLGKIKVSPEEFAVDKREELILTNRAYTISNAIGTNSSVKRCLEVIDRDIGELRAEEQRLLNVFEERIEQHHPAPTSYD